MKCQILFEKKDQELEYKLSYETTYYDFYGNKKKMHIYSENFEGI